MTAPVQADRGLLAALAIAYDQAGMRDRAAKLQHAGAHVGRELTSTSELTADEARNLRKHVRSCTATCPALVTVLTAPSNTCPCSTGGQRGRPSACDPTGTGRYCPPAICWCGACPSWKPAPEPNYAAAIAGAHESRGWR